MSEKDFRFTRRQGLKFFGAAEHFDHVVPAHPQPAPGEQRGSQQQHATQGPPQCEQHHAREQQAGHVQGQLDPAVGQSGDAQHGDG